MKKKDLLLLSVALALAALIFLIAHFTGRAQAPLGTVRILVDGQLYAQEPLGIPRDIEILQPDGKKNVVHLTGNGFFMSSSTCHNQLCVQQGEVNSENYYLRALGSRVICLPNRVEVELTLTHQTPPPDAPDI